MGGSSSGVMCLLFNAVKSKNFEALVLYPLDTHGCVCSLGNGYLGYLENKEIGPLFVQPSVLWLPPHSQYTSGTPLPTTALAAAEGMNQCLQWAGEHVPSMDCKASCRQ